MSRRLLFAQLCIVSVLAVLHLISIEFYLYWRFLWLDLVAHILGGIWAGLFILWMRSLFGYMPHIAWSIGGAFFIGIAWEIFEVAAGIPREANYMLDTSIDLFMDTLGGAIAGLLVLFAAKQRDDKLKMMI